MPSVALEAQLQVAMQLEHVHGILGTSLPRVIIPALEGYWRDRLSRQAFSFISPQLFLADLNKVSQMPWQNKMRCILWAAARSVDPLVARRWGNWFRTEC